MCNFPWNLNPSKWAITYNCVIILLETPLAVRVSDICIQLRQIKITI